MRCVYVPVCVCMYKRACLWRPEGNPGCSSHTVPPHFLPPQDLSLAWCGTHQVSYAHWPESSGDAPASSSPGLRFQACSINLAGFNAGSGTWTQILGFAERIPCWQGHSMLTNHDVCFMKWSLEAGLLFGKEAASVLELLVTGIRSRWYTVTGEGQLNPPSQFLSTVAPFVYF